MTPNASGSLHFWCKYTEMRVSRNGSGQVSFRSGPSSAYESREIRFCSLGDEARFHDVVGEFAGGEFVPSRAGSERVASCRTPFGVRKSKAPRCRSVRKQADAWRPNRGFHVHGQAYLLDVPIALSSAASICSVY